MATNNNGKIEKEIEELKKQVWLLTLKVKNLREATNKIKRSQVPSGSYGTGVAEKKNSKDKDDELDPELFKDLL